MTRIAFAFALAAATVTLGVPSNALADETNQVPPMTLPSPANGDNGGTEVGRVGGKIVTDNATPEVPPSRSGVRPALALTYDSSPGN